MKIQKSKRNKAKKHIHGRHRWQGYYSEDLDCKYCLHFEQNKRKCPYGACLYEYEKRDAVYNGRVKRREEVYSSWDT